jgi:hypothetical protein
MDVKVLGIDCAPGKGSTVFDGEEFWTTFTGSHLLRLPELADRLRKCAVGNLLICWDAPLTGPPCTRSICERHSAYTQRPVESFFRRTLDKKKYLKSFKAPGGISVLGYGNCPHWTVSRALLGLPQLGRYDKEPRFPLHMGGEDGFEPPAAGVHVVEVHPALALWLWRERVTPPVGNWHYKGEGGDEASRQRNRDVYVKLLRKIAGGFDPELEVPKLASENGDYLDAYASWLLGRMWVDERKFKGIGVGVLGDEKAGSFLLPRTGALTEAWEKFRDAEFAKHGNCSEPEEARVGATSR